ncbi:MAG: CPBP family glutamic-type intramembrane protease [Armatimonadota bacterium]|nr:CPBP family glutamic-type intramembrane protease [Armatimonadota bacterium]MDR7457271.1 CPBP family glutamic-type intramembrane protease [Armatimonadota bacterium]
MRPGARRPAADALCAAAAWVGVEAGVRWTAQALVVLPARDGPGLPGRLEAADAWALLAVAGLSWGLFTWLARTRGLGWSDLGYRFDRTVPVVGVLGGLVVGAVAATAAIGVDVPIFGLRLDDEVLRRVVEAGPWTAALMLLGNGLAGPAAEEYAWRGYIQRAATAAWGRAAGVALTAAAFAAKHVLLDLSTARTASLLVVAAGLGIVAARWGTAASTVAHVILNTSAAVALLVLALRGA